MTYDEFILSIENNGQPPATSIYLQALWWDAKGDWRKAHSLVDDLEDQAGCRVHAYLHRKEGDISNADYWYKNAQTQSPAVSLQEEWQMLVSDLLTA